LQLVGGLTLVYPVVRTLLERPPRRLIAESRPLAGAFASTLALTLSNPMTILWFTAIFASIGAGSLDLVSGVFCGSSTWWLLLTGAASLLRTRLSLRPMWLIYLGSGTLVVAFGLHSVALGLAQAGTPSGLAWLPQSR
jgi:threonine/homoserine/homoserine lactone efflux protein